MNSKRNHKKRKKIKTKAYIAENTWKTKEKQNLKIHKKTGSLENNQYR